MPVFFPIPLENIGISLGCWCFQEVSKKTSGMKWVNGERKFFLFLSALDSYTAVQIFL